MTQIRSLRRVRKSRVWRLSNKNEAKAKDAGKGGWQAMNRHAQEWSGGETCIASKTLAP